MRILIVSCEAWRDTNNGGNVLSNIFSAFPDAEIAQIYCSGEQPQNTVCQRYYQISDTMLLTATPGRKLDLKDYSGETQLQNSVVENKIKNKIPFIFKDAALLVRELLWYISTWKSGQLEQFILSFKPDVIFAPCYSYFHVSRLALYVKKIAGCPMISYISDDNYSLKQIKFSPCFWINRFITRKWIRRLFAECSLVYTMTDLQKNEYEALFGCPMKVLCKSADFHDSEKTVGKPICLIYAGGLYLNRWKVLAKLSNALAKINHDQVNAELHIYSGSKLDSWKAKKLNDGKNSFLHAAISYDELVQKYHESDVALHVEAFDIKNRQITRLSFSTKIIDCMSSGCAIMAIGPKGQAGIEYLSANEAAICIHNVNEFYKTLKNLVENKSIIQEYSKKAILLGRKNHAREDIEKMLINDFQKVVSACDRHISAPFEK